MKPFTSFPIPIHLRRTAQIAAAFALGGLLAVVYGAQKPDSSLDIRRSDQPIPQNQTEPVSFSGVVSRVSPSVVTIKVETKARRVKVNGSDNPAFNDPFFRQFFGNMAPGEVEQRPSKGLGSGVIISGDGYIVTNNHVVDGADSVSVTLSDGREYTAKVVGRDPQTDIAVVRIDAKGLPAITFADSDKARVGDRVLAIGNPFAIGETVTSGIISAKGRRVGILEDVKGIEDFIQTDAAINPGNSGGALVDVDGRLVGINSAIISHSGGFQGVGLAVPSDIVSHVAESLVKTGTVSRGYLGVNIQNVTPALQDEFKLKDRAGALVAEVVPDGPAAKAGVKDGDVITAIDGQPVSDANSLAITMSEQAPGEKVTLDIVRDGTADKVTVVSTERPGEPHRAGSDSVAAGNDQGVLNGVAVDDINRDTRQQFNIPGQLRGALITNVDPDSAAARAGVSAGDVILDINRHAVHSAQDAVDLSTKAEGKKTLLRLWSHGSTIFVVVDESKDAQSSS